MPIMTRSRRSLRTFPEDDIPRPEPDTPRPRTSTRRWKNPGTTLLSDNVIESQKTEPSKLGIWRHLAVKRADLKELGFQLLTCISVRCALRLVEKVAAVSFDWSGLTPFQKITTRCGIMGVACGLAVVVSGLLSRAACRQKTKIQVYTSIGEPFIDMTNKIGANWSAKPQLIYIACQFLFVLWDRYRCGSSRTFASVLRTTTFRHYPRLAALDLAPIGLMVPLMCINRAVREVLGGQCRHIAYGVVLGMTLGQFYQWTLWAQRICHASYGLGLED